MLRKSKYLYFGRLAQQFSLFLCAILSLDTQHGRFEIDNDSSWALPYTAASETAIEALFAEAGEESTVKTELAMGEEGMEWVTSREIKDAYDNAYSQIADLHNSEGMPHPLAQMILNPFFRKCVLKPFKEKRERVKQNPANRQSVVVLDCFAGFGTGIVCLKKLGIEIRKVIHVEHDKAATHV